MNKRKQRQERRILGRRGALRRAWGKAPTAEAQAVIEEICAAFEGVDRLAAISWNDADRIDDYGFGPGLFPDSDTMWEELVRDPSWRGGWCWIYLDPEGFRYYLPPAMVWDLLGDSRVELDFALSGESRRMPDPPYADRWAILSEPQVRAIRSYLRYMAQHRFIGYDPDDPGSWPDDLAAWEQFQPA